MDESRLRSVPLFAGLTRKELKLLSTMTDEATLAAGCTDRRRCVRTSSC